MSENKEFKRPDDSIPLSKLRRILKTLENSPPQTPITYQYMCSFFPHIYENTLECLKAAYDMGFEDGKKVVDNETN